MTNNDDFEFEARSSRKSIVNEFLYFLWRESKWWLAPILIAIGIVAALVLLAGSGAAPFVYTLF